MLTGQNSGVSANLATLVDKAGAKITHAIQSASAKTGVDFSYLLQQAQIESSFKADAKASTSSATGLYQFIDKTWLSMVDKYGDKHGITDVSNKKEVLALRKNPELCSLMAAEMAADNKDYLEKCTGQTAGSTELYMAHFMGPAGASKFLNAMNKNPDANAAALFPDAAAANKNVFYDKSGHAKSLGDVYAQFDKKFTIEPNTAPPVTTANIQPVPDLSPDLSTDNVTDNVMAAMGATMGATTLPLYTNTSSLFTNTPIASVDTQAATGIPQSFFAMISPVDVLELIKSQYTGHKVNS